MVSPFVITCLSNYDKKFFLEDIVSHYYCDFLEFCADLFSVKTFKTSQKKEKKNRSGKEITFSESRK